MKLNELLQEAAEEFSKAGRILNIEEKELLAVGDLHGDDEILERILKWWDGRLLFLGDYVDRGEHGLEVLQRVLELFLEGRAYVLRGNHESPLMNEDGGFLDELCFIKRVPNCAEIYNEIQRLYAEMPLAAVVNRSIFAVHGGIPLKEPEMKPASLADIRAISGGLAIPEDPIAYQLLWNDPCDCDSFRPSPRGFGIWLFGRRPTEAFLRREGLRLVLRGHLYVESGYAVHPAVLTIFSSRAGPYERVKPKVAHLARSSIAIRDALTGDELKEIAPASSP
ncbi:MAG: metallophosphoesterase [Thermoproteus sp.]|nr:metallophosphoesterase [Thermoproteus sp.]